ncbi:MAG: biotin transporter BioY [Anaerolineales bacterium]
MNYTDILHPQNPVHSRYANIVLVLGTSWLIALSAQITFQIPFSPVPVTGQTLVVLLCGLILGKNLAAAAVGTYLLQGAAGLPFFAGGKSGIAALLGPTGGYLFGFLAAAYIVGMLSELRYRRSPLQAATTLLLGNIVIYLFGLTWLVRFTGEAQALQLGLYPFLIGDAVKLVLAIVIISGGSWLTDRFQLEREPR